ncbi:MAG: VTC domain-containing protein, partial [Clostridia bacterium]|nr:VTC domain-containing protein [Clostridia bacterium]
MFKDNFSRYEFKFPMTYRDVDRLIGELLAYVEPDEHVGPEGIYTISSLYMDNDRLQCYYETINNDYFRQKVRLRVYGAHNVPESPAYLEVKSKIDGLVVKRRVKMTLADAMDFCDKCVTKGYEFDAGLYKSTNPQILEEVRRVIVSKDLHFVNCVSYDRIPYFCSADP